jgi:hypothetical protein
LLGKIAMVQLAYSSEELMMGAVQDKLEARE